jgi:hypothetical protein
MVNSLKSFATQKHNILSLYSIEKRRERQKWIIFNEHHKSYEFSARPTRLIKALLI